MEKTRHIRFDIVTIFPEAFQSHFNTSLLRRAQEKKLVRIALHNLRDFAEGKHKKVDDTPYGGGAGMVLKIEPVYRAVQSIARQATSDKRHGKKKRIILFSTRGKKFDAKAARRLAKYDQLVLICGRYEGVDERVAKHIADEEISVGDFVLAGGELPAMIVVEAVARFIPGVLGKQESLEEIKGSYPVYTRPEVFRPATRDKGQGTRQKKREWAVPKILLSGNHDKIRAWRSSHR